MYEKRVRLIVQDTIRFTLISNFDTMILDQDVFSRISVSFDIESFKFYTSLYRKRFKIYDYTS